MNGHQTLDENVADLTGLQLALEAMEVDARALKLESQLPDLRRDFFVAYAQARCAFEPGGFDEVEAAADPHAPPHVRINRSVANMAAFAAAFQCPAGAPLAPRERCNVW